MTQSEPEKQVAKSGGIGIYALIGWTLTATIPCLAGLAMVFAPGLALSGPPRIAAQVELPERTQWLTGANLDKAILLSLSVAWEDAPLRARITELSQRQRIAVFIDRRVDPNLPINLQIKDTTWEQFLSELTRKYQLSCCRLGDVYYIGPGDWATRLAVQLEALENRAGQAGSSRLKRRPLRWPRLAEPQSVAGSLMKTARISLVGVESIPHDVWVEGDLPLGTWIQHLSLILVGFEKSFEIDGDLGSATIRSFPAIVSGKRTFRGVANARSLQDEVSNRFPELEIKLTASSIEARGPIEELAELATFLNQTQTATQGEERFSLSTRAQRGAILASLAQQTSRSLNYPAEARTALAEVVAIDVKEQSIDTIIEEVVKDTDWTWELTSDKLNIKSRK